MSKRSTVCLSFMAALGLVLLIPSPGVAVDSCSVSGAYNLDGFALDNTQILGFAVFTPTGPCTGGTFTASVTVKGSPPVHDFRKAPLLTFSYLSITVYLEVKQPCGRRLS